MLNVFGNKEREVLIGSHDSAPPEADREADVQRADIMPAARWDVQHLTRVQSALHVLCTLEEREASGVR